jgi:hypothetical protein
MVSSVVVKHPSNAAVDERDDRSDEGLPQATGASAVATASAAVESRDKNEIMADLKCGMNS